MTTILRLDCSPRGPAGHSWRIADELVERLGLAHPGVRLVRRDLVRAPPPLADAVYAAAMVQHQSAEASLDVPALAASEALIRELDGADILVIATPMQNFTVPAQLKAWLDQVVRVGRTFQGTPEGKVGRLADRPAYVVVASGGYIAGERALQPDFLRPYLAAILATLGIRDTRFIVADGLSRGEAALADAYARARADMAAAIAR